MMRALFERPFVRASLPRRAGKTPEAWLGEVRAMSEAITPEVTDRHLEIAFHEQMRQLQTDAGERIAEPGWRAHYDKLVRERYDHPSVRSIADLLAAQEALEERVMLRFSVRMGDDDDPDPPAWQEFTDAKRSMDEGALGGAERPSQVFELNRHLLDSAWIDSPAKSKRQCREARENYERSVLALARQRYRDGFYADPFAAEPRRRTTTNGER